MADISKIQLPDGNEYDIKDAKSRMVILKYGISTWDEFINAYNNKTVIFCRASSGSNPAVGSQTRLAFMAYVNDETTPTEVEFQYYRSINSHNDSQQGDQVYIYKLNKTNGWSVTTRNAFTKVIAGTGLTSSFTTGTSSKITLSFDTADASDIVYDNTMSGLSSTNVQGVIDEVASDIDKSNAVFINFSATGHTLDEEYEITDGWWTFDSITDADGNSLTYTDLFSAFQDGKNIFLNATSTIQSSTYYYKNIQMSGVDSTVTDPDTTYYISFDFVDGVSNNPSTWRVWTVIYDSINPIIYQINVDGSDADNIRYSNTTSGLTATDVQDAIDELKSDIPTDASDVSYDNTSSGLTATDVQNAIDEVKADIPTDLMDLVGSASKGDVLVYDGASIIAQHGWYTTDATWIGYDNYASGLSADYVGDAIDELASGKNPLIANYTSTSQSSISLSSGTTSSAFTNVTSVNLTPGIWLLFGTLNFATNNSGTRAGLISASSNATGANYWGTVLTGAADGMNTRIQVISIVAPTSNITYYLEAKQTSGSSLTTTGQLNYLKLS